MPETLLLVTEKKTTKSIQTKFALRTSAQGDGPSNDPAGETSLLTLNWEVFITSTTATADRPANVANFNHKPAGNRWANFLPCTTHFDPPSAPSPRFPEVNPPIAEICSIGPLLPGPVLRVLDPATD